MLLNVTFYTSWNHQEAFGRKILGFFVFRWFKIRILARNGLTKEVTVLRIYIFSLRRREVYCWNIRWWILFRVKIGPSNHAMWPPYFVEMTAINGFFVILSNGTASKWKKVNYKSKKERKKDRKDLFGVYRKFYIVWDFFEESW